MNDALCCSSDSFDLFLDISGDDQHHRANFLGRIGP